MTISAAAPAQALEIKYKYYDNYFYSLATCKARGDSLTKSQPDWISYRCYRDTGDSKWSMDAYIEDGFGCIVESRTEMRATGQFAAGDVEIMCP